MHDGIEVMRGEDALAAADASQTSTRSNDGSLPASRRSRASTSGELFEKLSMPTTP